ncbi:helix-turn-helix domain-containing protein [Paenibacillus apiarius]|uniref:Helix-turn-helix domain-containing protein n=1 Tax=Paenibacillus apiarius TaxID=46240 RepID=A0ABT4DV55_9BACL|nr:helix-turn-helix transcriptional regulator [Paenibacillus apiarius]MCY9516405.1 helix-turn-helix domain-containing protein [Paenibacillus apiarius]MCY9521135.1 helix-turn-helix domain-containing protein [Paenibacillus apiarius]MCY9551982.1 helix-turn-helix domain-containing protein [Paenibacillus apiarius]MCY9560927.1 helix-turn-helix domain-containing protein [Paenibacillus apiarius]MCY9684556.1 helix-turn-helix domain-containing protein [Paenibacillus apiarius]
MSTGIRIAELREGKGWTQEELAELLGITRAALSHYEKDRRKPDFETLTKLADQFEVSIDYLVGRLSSPNAQATQEVLMFADGLELSDEELLKKFRLTVDGRELTEDEARRFIAFVRAERSMRP